MKINNNVDYNMLVDTVNHVFATCNVISKGRNNTCPTKLINGVLHFKFKGEWHELAKFAYEKKTHFRG